MLGVMFSHSSLDFFREASVWYSLFIGSAVLFFMTSGAMILPVKEPTKVFLKRRVLRLLPEFLIWSVAYLIFKHIEFPDLYPVKFHIEWIVFEPTWGAGWFIYALIGLYLFAPVITPWIKQASKRAVECYLAIWMFSGFMYFAQQFFERDITTTMFSSFFNVLGYMIAGYYLTRWPVNKRPRKEKIVFWGVMFFIGVIYALRINVTGLRYGYEHIFTEDLSINTMAMTLMTFAILLQIKSAPKFIEKVITLISVNSYEIYLCHIAVMDYIVKPLGYGAWPTIILTIVLSTIIGWILTVFVNKIRRLCIKPRGANCSDCATTQNR